MTLRKRSLIIASTFLVVSAVSWLLGGEATFSIVTAVLVATFVGIAAGIRERPDKRT